MRDRKGHRKLKERPEDQGSLVEGRVKVGPGRLPVLRGLAVTGITLRVTRMLVSSPRSARGDRRGRL